jgi:hypothetical protein
MTEIHVTRFKGRQSTTPLEHTTLAIVLEDIKNGKWKARIEKCHIDLKYKDFLPCFTPTGNFSHRSIAGLEDYNGVICLDIDHVDEPELLKKRASKLNYVHAAFVTPSGRGLKVIVLTNSTRERYVFAENIIADWFSLDAGGIRDNRCKDIARIQYISYDPDLYYNPESQIVDIPEQVIDRKGKKCKCKKGKYVETELLDDLSGTLHCNKCGDKIERYERI